MGDAHQLTAMARCWCTLFCRCTRGRRHVCARAPNGSCPRITLQQTIWVERRTNCSLKTV